MRLDDNVNNQANWVSDRESAQRRIEVDRAEVQRTIELARRTPGLREYEDELRQLAVFFEIATTHYQENDPDELTGLVAFWDRYRAAITQRYTGLTPNVLRSADKVVGDVFGKFLAGVPEANISYSRDARPLVYGGDGGLGGYFTHPPGWKRPFAIINLPHAAFDNVWRWLALPHETGHDTYAAVANLPNQVEEALAAAMTDAVDDGTLVIPDLDVDLTPAGIPHQIQYTGAELISKIWTS